MDALDLPQPHPTRQVPNAGHNLPQETPTRSPRRSLLPCGHAAGSGLSRTPAQPVDSVRLMAA
jgi:hypothetical protein